jgi:hypothetical protein
VVNDWPGQQMWKKGDEQAVVQQAVFLHFPAIGINQKCNLSEREEAYPEWKYDIDKGYLRSRQDIYIGDEKVDIFKIRETKKVHDYPEYKDFFPFERHFSFRCPAEFGPNGIIKYNADHY